MIRWSSSSSSPKSTEQHVGTEDAKEDYNKQVSSSAAMTMMKFEKNKRSSSSLSSLSENDTSAKCPWLMQPPCCKVYVRSDSAETASTTATNGVALSSSADLTTNSWSSSATLNVVDRDNNLDDSIKQAVLSYYDSRNNNKMKKMKMEKKNVVKSKKFKTIDARKIRDPDDDIRYEVSNRNDSNDEDDEDSSRRRGRLCTIFSRRKKFRVVMNLR